MARKKNQTETSPTGAAASAQPQTVLLGGGDDLVVPDDYAPANGLPTPPTPKRVAVDGTRDVGSRMLWCELTDEQVAQRTLAAVRIDEEIEALERRQDDLAELVKGIKGEILSLRQKQRALGRTALSRREERPIACYEVTRGVQVTIVRSDLGTAVEEREMTPDERQVSF